MQDETAEGRRCSGRCQQERIDSKDPLVVAIREHCVGPSKFLVPITKRTDRLRRAHVDRSCFRCDDAALVHGVLGTQDRS
jgi:hypothetical protein